MNVFLGCYVPGNEDTPLWRVRSSPAQSSLRPAESYVDRVLFKDDWRHPPHVWPQSRSQGHSCLRGRAGGARGAEGEMAGAAQAVAAVPGVIFLEGGNSRQYHLHYARRGGGRGGAICSDRPRSGLTRYVIRTRTKEWPPTASHEPRLTSSSEDDLRYSRPSIFGETLGKKLLDLRMRRRAPSQPTRLVKIKLWGSGQEAPLTDSALRSVLRSEKRKYIAATMKRRMKDAEECGGRPLLGPTVLITRSWGLWG